MFSINIQIIGFQQYFLQMQLPYKVWNQLGDSTKLKLTTWAIRLNEFLLLKINGRLSINASIALWKDLKGPKG